MMTAARAMINNTNNRRQQGSALIEFAFALAVVVPVMAGGWQFYEAYLRIEEVQQAAIRGVEFGSNLPYDSAGETPTAEFERAVENVMLFGNPRGTEGTAAAAPVVRGLRREMIDVRMGFAAGRPAELTVSVRNLKLPLPGGGLLLQGKPRASYPYRGHWSPALPDGR